MKRDNKKVASLVLGTALAGSVMLSGCAQSSGSCGANKCGNKAKAKSEKASGSCGANSCGAAKAEAKKSDGGCGANSCGSK